MGVVQGENRSTKDRDQTHFLKDQLTARELMLLLYHYYS